MTDNSPLGAGATKPLRLGTRRSKLAMAQSGLVAEAVSEVTGRAVELVEITTYGDISKEQLSQIGGTGVFVAALREALLRGEVDFAVHSLKDLPTAQPEGLVLAAVPVREDPRDVLVARDGLTLGQLPPGSRIGTGSPRRMAQLNAYARAHGLGIETVPIRGNVDTRIGFVRSGELDAVVLAAAGLSRLGRTGEVTDFLSVDTVLPAPGQGALAIECAASSADLAAALAELDDPYTRAAVTAERALLAALEAAAPHLWVRWPTSWPTVRLSTNCACAGSSGPPTVPRWCSCPPPVPSPRRTTTRRPSVANSRPRCSPRVRPVLWGSEHFEPHRPRRIRFPCPVRRARHLPRRRSRRPGTADSARRRGACERGRSCRRAGRSRRRSLPCAGRRKHA